MIELCDAGGCKTRPDVGLDAQIIARLVGCSNRGRQMCTEMAVVGIAQRWDDKQFLSSLPIIHDIGAVVVE